jgi:hypothetical protein
MNQKTERAILDSLLQSQPIIVQAKLPLLATWLGHVSIFSTYYYLHFVEDLRSLANRRFTEQYGGLVAPFKIKGADR